MSTVVLELGVRVPYMRSSLKGMDFFAPDYKSLKYPEELSGVEAEGASGF